MTMTWENDLTSVGSHVQSRPISLCVWITGKNNNTQFSLVFDALWENNKMLRPYLRPYCIILHFIKLQKGAWRHYLKFK